MVEKFLDIITILDNQIVSESDIQAMIDNKTNNFLTESQINTLLLDLEENLQNQLNDNSDSISRLEHLIETDIPEDYVSKTQLNLILDEALTYLNDKYN